MNPSQMAASCDPPPSMDAFDSLCEHCYGLAMDCLHCNLTGSAHSENNMWDPWQYSDLESSPHCLADGLSIQADKQDQKTGSNSQYAKPSQWLHQPSSSNPFQQFAIRGSEEALCDEPAKAVISEQNQEIPAYRRHKKSKAQIDLLKGWFETNPTPTGPQLSEYAKLSGLEKDQVRNWFVNQRRPGRGLKSKNVPRKGKDVLKRYSGEAILEFEKGSEDGATASTQPIPIAGISHKSSLSDSLRSVPDMPESMLERWQNSPPDEEPANLSAIRNALDSSRGLRREPSLKRQESAFTGSEINIMVVIENIPLDITIDQFMQIMLFKNIPRPRNLNYEFRKGVFCGLAFAEFDYREDALFAISTLDHSPLSGVTLSAYLESPLSGPEKSMSTRAAPHEELEDVAIDAFNFQKPKVEFQKPRERTYDYYSAPSTNGSASSAARSTSSSISLARRQYKQTYRRPARRLQSTSSTPDGDEPEQPFFRKRNRIPLSCGPCRHRKLKCNRSHPCENCIRRGDISSCSYASPQAKKRNQNQSQTTTNHDIMQKRIDRLEGLVLSLMTNGALSALSVITDASAHSIAVMGSQPKDQSQIDYSAKDMQARIDRLESLALTLMTNGALTADAAPDLARNTLHELEHHVSSRNHSCQRYHCEFCAQKFSTEEDWREHETGIHRPKEEWICSVLPYINVDSNIPPSKADCIFCQDSLDFDQLNMYKQHRCRPCGVWWDSPLAPVFNTRSELADHVKHQHRGAALTDLMLEKWSVPPKWKNGIWTCNICGASLQGWENRLNHLAMHHNLRGCSCPSISSTKPAAPGNQNDDKDFAIAVPGLEIEDTVSGSFPVSDTTVPPEQTSNGFVSRVRAWITRMMRKP
ncbi:hypothetical protein BDZ45DRAFT_694700 [Acephala macrosclerotiorum]|nr:hypothetical protein BDZ45DRAFT_694700 [Acephala macrosclerotiorum]